METSVHSKLAEVWEFAESDRARFGSLWIVTEGGLMRRYWVDGSKERMW